MSAVTNDPAVHARLLQMLYRLTDRDGGVLLTQVPRADRKVISDVLVPRWQALPGIDVRFRTAVNSVMAIRRSSGSPDVLPFG